MPDPVLGLSEIARVVRGGGRVLLLEHMRPANPILGALMDARNPLMVRRIGANMNRRTVDNLRASGLQSANNPPPTSPPPTVRGEGHGLRADSPAEIGGTQGSGDAERALSKVGIFSGGSGRSTSAVGRQESQSCDDPGPFPGS